MKVSADREAHAQVAYTHILTLMPELRGLFEAVGVQEMPTPDRTNIPSALSKIVVGQMLSGSVADVIYRRVEKRIEECNVQFAWELPSQILIECGLSRRKIRTLQEFGESYRRDPESVKSWRALPFDMLKSAVSSYWGLGEWSAAMLAIFHLGHVDVFPVSDGSLFRAIDMLKKAGVIVRPDLATPYRSYLCLYLWAGLDRRYLKDA
ncbi:MAG: hypothetical protein WBO95_16480 [Candidatus Dechloromonas phosphoritropha]|jgi:DNA-3-methyladenine glycosylase II